MRSTARALGTLLTAILWLGVAATAHAQKPEAHFSRSNVGFDDLAEVEGSPLGVRAVAGGTTRVDGVRSVVLRAYDRRGDESFLWGTGGRATVPCPGVPLSIAGGHAGDLFILCGTELRHLTPAGVLDTAFGESGVSDVGHPLEEPQSAPGAPFPTYYNWKASEISASRDWVFVHGVLSGPYPQNPRPGVQGLLARTSLGGDFDESYGESGFRQAAGGGSCASSALAVSDSHRVIQASASYQRLCESFGGLRLIDFGVDGEGHDGVGGGADDPKPRIWRVVDLAFSGGEHPVALSSNYRGTSDSHALSDARRFEEVTLGGSDNDVALTAGAQDRVVGAGSTHQGLDLRSFNRRLAERSQLSVDAPSGWNPSVREIVRLRNRYLIVGHRDGSGGFVAWVDGDAVER